MGMYDVLTSQGVAPGNTYNVQGQLYSKLGGNLGNYSGTAQQNTWLQSALGGRNYNDVLNPPPPAGQSPAPSSPPPAAPPSTAPAPPQYGTYANAANAINQETQDQYTKLLNPVTDAQSSLKAAQDAVVNYYKNLVPITDRYNQLYSQYGIDNLQNQSNTAASQLADTQNRLDSLQGDVMQSTSPFLMSMADRNLYYNQQAQPLNQAISAQSRAQQVADKALSDKMSALQYMMGLQQTQDQEGAKPFELGATYAGNNLTNAQNLYSELAKQVYQTETNKLTGANNDIKAYNDYQTNQQDMANKLEIERAQEAAQQALEQMRESSAASLEASKEKNDQTIANMKLTDSATAQKQAAQAAWNSLASNDKIQSTYDLWKYVNDNWNTLAANGVDPQQVLNLNNAYVAKYGQDAPVAPGKKAGGRYTGKPF